MIHISFEAVLCCQTGVCQIARLVLPFIEASVIKIFQIIFIISQSATYNQFLSDKVQIYFAEIKKTA